MPFAAISNAGKVRAVRVEPPIDGDRRPWSIAGAIALVTVLAVAPRFAGLRDAGPFVWDDGIHLLEGRWLETGSEALARSAERWLTERRTGEDVWRIDPELAALHAETQGIPLFFPRPGFAALVAVALHYTHGADWSGALVSAIAGVLTTVLVTALGCRLWGARPGALAGTALALCGWHVAYSRMAFAESASLVFATASMALLLAECDRRPRAHRITLGGISWGLACLVQDRLLPLSLVPILVAYGLLRTVRRDRRTAAAQALATIGTPVALLQMLAELPYYLAMLALAHFQRTLPFPTHVERLLKHYEQGVAISGFRPENLPTYPFLYGRLLGPGLALAVIAGLVGAWRRGGRTERSIALWLWLPLVPASLTAAGARYAAITLPAAALLAGWALDPMRWPESVRRRLGPSGSWLASGALIATAVPFAVAPIGWTSGHRDAMAAVRSSGVRCVVATDPYVDAVYLDFDLDRARMPPKSGDDLHTAWEKGCALYVVDAIGAVLRSRDHGIDDTLDSFEQAVPEPLTFPSAAAASILFPFEYNFSFPTTLAYLRGRERERAGTIRIYPLAALARPVEPPPEGGTPPTPEAPPSARAPAGSYD